MQYMQHTPLSIYHITLSLSVMKLSILVEYDCMVSKNIFQL